MRVKRDRAAAQLPAWGATPRTGAGDQGPRTRQPGDYLQEFERNTTARTCAEAVTSTVELEIRLTDSQGAADRGVFADAVTYCESSGGVIAIDWGAMRRPRTR